jgi:hypothetical protein
MELAAEIRALASSGETTAAGDAYVIECTQGVRGDCTLWWRPNSCGYTTDLREAGRYTREDAESICRGPPARPGTKPDREEFAYRLVDVLPLGRVHVDRCAVMRLRAPRETATDRGSDRKERHDG